MTTYTITGYAALLSAYTAATGNVPATATEATFTGYARSGAITLTYDTAANTVTWTEGFTFIATATNTTPDVGLAFYDASTVGNLLFAMPIASTTVANGTSASFGPGSFIVPANLFTPMQQTPMGTAIGSVPVANGAINAGAVVTAGVPLAVNGASIVAGQQSAPVAAAYASGTVSVNGAVGLRQAVTLTAASTLNVSNLPVNQTVKLYVHQDGTGSRTLAEVAGMKSVGGTISLTATASAVDRVDIDFDGTTSWITTFKAFA